MGIHCYFIERQYRVWRRGRHAHTAQVLRPRRRARDWRAATAAPPRARAPHHARCLVRRPGASFTHMDSHNECSMQTGRLSKNPRNTKRDGRQPKLTVIRGKSDVNNDSLTQFQIHTNISVSLGVAL